MVFVVKTCSCSSHNKVFQCRWLTSISRVRYSKSSHYWQAIILWICTFAVQLWRSMDADDSEACGRESNNYNFVSIPHVHVWALSLELLVNYRESGSQLCARHVFSHNHQISSHLCRVTCDVFLANITDRLDTFLGQTCVTSCVTSR